MRKFALLLVLCISSFAVAGSAPPIYNYKLKTIDGDPTSLAPYKGKVLLLVNVASACGFTPQYTALESLYEKYKDRGLVVIGIPANNFANQESGTDAEIKTFCNRKYHVTFPIMSKVSVLGPDKIAPLPVPHRQVHPPRHRRRHQMELHQVPSLPQRHPRRPLRTRRHPRLPPSHHRRRVRPPHALTCRLPPPPPGTHHPGILNPTLTDRAPTIPPPHGPGTQNPAAPQAGHPQPRCPTDRAPPTPPPHGPGTPNPAGPTDRVPHLREAKVGAHAVQLPSAIAMPSNRRRHRRCPFYAVILSEAKDLVLRLSGRHSQRESASARWDVANHRTADPQKPCILP